MTRSAHSSRSGDVHWDPARGEIDAAALDGCDAVIHLAGESVAKRWTSSRRARIRDSRVSGTRLLAETLASLRSRPRVLVSTSAVGIYGSRGDELLRENSASGDDFLSRIGREWESAADPARAAGIRVVHPRIGIVLSRRGGALGKMLPLFRFGLGGKFGNGRQWMSWIAMTDLVRAMVHVVETETVQGPVNFVAPNPVRNAEFAKTLGRVMHRPALIPAPAFALKLILGAMAEGTVLASQRVEPVELTRSGFRFTYDRLEEALRAELSSQPAAGA